MMNREILLRTQSYERYMQTYGTDLIRTYNQFNGVPLKEIQIYVDPHEGKIRADVVLENNARIPLLADVEPDWELSTMDETHKDAMAGGFQEMAQQVLEERKGWENG